MAHSKFANAVVVQPQVSQRGWGKVRKTAASPSRDIMTQAAEILGAPLDPDKFLLTHSTIVASVDVDAVPNVRLGTIKMGRNGRTINRKYGDYHIQPQCSQFVNNNGDSWARKVLLASYPTFIGAHNFLEHVQIEEQSKGRIIDAVARDIGESVYVDILVATNRAHSQLITDIETQKVATLSMGCSVEETICTKCGNVAIDETDLCPCIKYEKLNKFIDEQGQQRIVAELCGHPDIEENAGVHFIEASWVAVPAFTGAVLRNILEPTALPDAMARRLQAILNTPPPQWDSSQRVLAASLGVSGMSQPSVVVGRVSDRKAQFDFGDEDEEEGEGGGEAPAEPEDPMQNLQDEVYEAVTQRVVQKIKDDLQKKDTEEAISPEESSMEPNDSIIKEGYTGAVKGLLKKASSEVEFIDSLAAVNRAFGVRLSRDLYRAALKVGPTTAYPNLNRFLTACHHAVGRQVTPADVRALVRIGKLLDSLSSPNTLRHREGEIR